MIETNQDPTFTSPTATSRTAIVDAIAAATMADGTAEDLEAGMAAACSTMATCASCCWR